MAYSWFDLAGNIGVALIIITYLLLQLEKLKSEALAYSLLNAVGAALIILSLVFDNFNLSALMVEAFWVVISLLGIGRYFLKRRENTSDPSALP